MIRFGLLVFISALFSCSTRGPAEILVLPTIHGAHKMNSSYSYDDLFDIIHHFKPDLIGVEVRPEDVKQPSSYLKNFYPQEMIMMRDSFPEKAVGIDFYGNSFEGELLPAEVFKDTTNELGRFINFERLMAVDSLLLKQREQLGLSAILEEQKQIAISYSPEDLINGEYDSLTTRYYNLLESILEGSPYEEYLKFNTQRDQKITANALKLIDENPGKRILILLGANHRARLVDTLEKKEGIHHLEDLKFPSDEKGG